MFVQTRGAQSWVCDWARHERLSSPSFRQMNAWRQSLQLRLRVGWGWGWSSAKTSAPLIPGAQNALLPFTLRGICQPFWMKTKLYGIYTLASRVYRGTTTPSDLSRRMIPLCRLPKAILDLVRGWGGSLSSKRKKSGSRVSEGQRPSASDVGCRSSETQWWLMWCEDRTNLWVWR